MVMLVLQYSKMPKNVNRSLYTYRIMDIIKQIRKQKLEIQKVSNTDEIHVKGPRPMHNVKINDWFTMDNDNVEIEWRRLNMINLDFALNIDLEDKIGSTTSEWNRLNMNQ